MWRGAIQFGLVTIPVKLYLATESRGGLSFHLLHKTCLNRIQMKTHCPEHGEIARSDTIRGFEWSKGQYVIIEESDLEAVPLKTVRAIEIEQFVDADPGNFTTTFVKQAYYIEPEPIGRKAFYLLKSVLADSGLQGICKIVLKDREALAALNPYSRTMLLSTLYWPDEVRDIGELELPDEEFEFKPAERQMASQLVQAMTGEFDPQQYRDEYREALMAVIQAKIDGQPVGVREQVVEPGKLTDLMAVLEASVAAARESRGREAAGEPTAASGRGSRARKTAEEPTSVDEARKTRVAGSRAPAKAAATRSTGKAAVASKPAAAGATPSKTAAARTERRRKTA
jgi:DNA end-binding protein Ku